MSEEEKLTKEGLKEIKIGSKLEAKWTDTLNKAEDSIMVDNMNLEISKAIVEIAKKHIKSEKETFK